MHFYSPRLLASYLILTLAASLSIVSSMDMYSLRYFDNEDSRMVATSNYNYALVSPKLAPKSWRTVSVNGDSVVVTTNSGQRSVFTKSQINQADLALIESLRDEISKGGSGFTQSSLGSSSGGDYMMSSSLGRISSSSFTSTSNGFSTITSGEGPKLNDLSVSMKDGSNFSVSKSNLPFNWGTVFFNGDLVTIVFRNGDVEMQPTNAIEATQLEALEKLKAEVKEIQRTQSQQLSNTMKHSVDMVSNIFSNIMGRFPKPPDYQSAVGGAFGNNFPFGPENSPFSSAAGWPFSSGSYAFAGSR